MEKDRKEESWDEGQTDKNNKGEETTEKQNVKKCKNTQTKNTRVRYNREKKINVSASLS